MRGRFTNQDSQLVYNCDNYFNPKTQLTVVNESQQQEYDYSIIQNKPGQRNYIQNITRNHDTQIYPSFTHPAPYSPFSPINSRFRNRQRKEQRGHRTKKAIFKGVEVKICLQKYNSLKKDILMVPFTSASMKQPIIISLMKKVEYSLQAVIKSYFKQIPEGHALLHTAGERLHFQHLFLTKFPNPALERGRKIELIRSAISNTFLMCLQYGFQSIVIPGLKVKNISQEEYMKIIFKQIFVVISIIKQKAPRSSFKEVIMCTNHINYFLDWSKWFNEFLKEYFTTNPFDKSDMKDNFENEKDKQTDVGNHEEQIAPQKE